MDIETFKRNIVPMRQMLVVRARSMTGDDSQAEDLVQEVMLKMWDRRTEIEAMLAEDKKQAKKIREVVEDGTVTSGYYQMDALRTGMNRYVLFSKGKKGDGTLIYIEGRLKPEDVMVLCYGKSK